MTGPLRSIPGASSNYQKNRALPKVTIEQALGVSN